jgi:predicted outer membrane protein
VLTRVLVRAVLAAAVLGCDRGGKEDAANTPAADANLVATAELLMPVRSASTAEAEFGQAAAGRATGADIRSYAQTIAADHRALLAALDSASRAMTLPAVKETATAQELANAVRTAHSGLETLTAGDYDLAFIRAEVESHRLLLARLDQELIPGAADAATRTLLTDIRAMVDAHLTRARQLLANVLDRPAIPAETAPPPVRPAAPPTPPVSTGG